MFFLKRLANARMMKMTRGFAVLLFLLTYLSLIFLTCTSVQAYYPRFMELVSTITIEKKPLSLAVNEETNSVYVGVEGGLIVIDCESNEIVTEIPLQFGAEVVVVNARTNRIFASGSSADAIYVIDGDAYSVVGQIPGRLWDSYEIAVNPVTNLVYVASRTVTMYRYDKVLVYDGVTLTQVASIDIPGSYAHQYIENVGVSVNPLTNRIYATWSGDNSVHLIDGGTHQIVRTMEDLWETDFSLGVFVNPVTNYLYIGHGVRDGETFESLVAKKGLPTLAISEPLIQSLTLYIPLFPNT